MILNRQRRVRVSISGLEKFLAAARKRLRLAPRSLTVALVTDAQIASWNRAYRGKNRPTDVLSFPATCPKQNPQLRETIVRRLPHVGRAPHASLRLRPRQRRRTRISVTSPSHPPSLAATRIRLGRAFDHEMRILILHGILHLLGYDHETDSGQMDRRENRLRRDLGLL